MLPQQQAQLRSMFLHVAQRVQLQLEKGGFHPLEDAALLRPLVRQRLERCPAALATLAQIGVNLLPGVGLIW